MSFYILLILSILWFGFMTWLSHQNGNKTAETSRQLALGLGVLFQSKDLKRLNGKLRKTAHVILFTVLTTLVLLTVFVGKISSGFWLVVSLISIWALLDEATKPLIQGRHFSWKDVALNLIGVAIGSVIGSAITLL